MSCGARVPASVPCALAAGTSSGLSGVFADPGVRLTAYEAQKAASGTFTWGRARISLFCPYAR